MYCERNYKRKGMSVQSERPCNLVSNDSGYFNRNRIIAHQLQK